MNKMTSSDTCKSVAKTYRGSRVPIWTPRRIPIGRDDTSERKFLKTAHARWSKSFPSDRRVCNTRNNIYP